MGRQQSIIGNVQEGQAMVRDEGRRITPEVLLGRPLNDVEDKFAPRFLNVKGPMQIPLPRPRVSIVGARKASQAGIVAAGTIAKDLARMEVVIVSGLAEGVDTSAHEAAIAAGGRTRTRTPKVIDQIHCRY